MKSLKFHKMQGAGNDFVVLDNRTIGLSKDELIALTPKLCDRKFGIGADGVLELDFPQVSDVDFTMIYRNADGSDAGMCGNGARCLAMYAAHHGFQNEVVFNVHDTLYKASVNKIDNSVTVYFPDVHAPSLMDIDGEKLLQIYPGTEHVVCFVDEELLNREKDLIERGRYLRYSELLNPPGTNVNFISVNKEDTISLQTYERGVENLTLACGTGAIASAISAHHSKHPSSGTFEREVIVKGGILSIGYTFDQENNLYRQVSLTGPAEFVYEGLFHI